MDVISIIVRTGISMGDIIIILIAGVCLCSSRRLAIPVILTWGSVINSEEVLVLLVCRSRRARVERCMCAQYDGMCRKGIYICTLERIILYFERASDRLVLRSPARRCTTFSKEGHNSSSLGKTDHVQLILGDHQTEPTTEPR